MSLSMTSLDFWRSFLIFRIIVQQMCAIYQYNSTKNGKGLIAGTKEAYTIY